jgi:hypothetical protein
LKKKKTTAWRIQKMLRMMQINLQIMGLIAELKLVASSVDPKKLKRYATGGIVGTGNGQEEIIKPGILLKPIYNIKVKSNMRTKNLINKIKETLKG